MMFLEQNVEGIAVKVTVSQFDSA